MRLSFVGAECSLVHLIGCVLADSFCFCFCFLLHCLAHHGDKEIVKLCSRHGGKKWAYWFGAVGEYFS